MRNTSIQGEESDEDYENYEHIFTIQGEESEESGEEFGEREESVKD